MEYIYICLCVCVFVWANIDEQKYTLNKMMNRKGLIELFDILVFGLVHGKAHTNWR